MFATEALYFVKGLKYSNTLLDIGSGKCEHSKWILDNTDMQVTATDIVDPPEWEYPGRFNYIQGFFQDINNPYTIGYDVVFISHVLEHQLNAHDFLVKALASLRESGWIVITFPPLKHQIVGGHVSLWNAGLLLYHLVLAGISCKYPKIKQYGYNVTVAVQKNSIQVPRLKFDNGDIETLSEFLPLGYNHQGFNGDIKKLYWEGIKVYPQ